MRSRTPAIGRRCPQVWTDDDERGMVAAAIALREDIESAGGLDAWIRDRLEDWLPGPECSSGPPLHTHR